MFGATGGVMRARDPFVSECVFICVFAVDDVVG
jgi:hypothetical protein